MMPLSTSPVPAVASRASPAVTTSASPSGSATIVAAPFSSTVQPLSAASRRAATMRSAPGWLPDSSAYSPSCGVKTVGTVRRRSSAVAPSELQPRANNPSPSITIGSGASTTSLRTLAAVSSDRPSPGPTTTAWNRSSDASAASAQPVLGSGRWTISIGASVSVMPGIDRCTMPAPVRIAAWATRPRCAGHGRAAGDDPHARSATCARTRRARATSRRRRQPAPGLLAPSRCRARCRPTRARRRARCRAASAARASRPRTSPCATAARTSPAMSPVSASTPLGTSTASTGVSPTSGGVQVPWNPVPYAASITRSDGGSTAGYDGTSNTRTAHTLRGQMASRDPAIGTVVAVAAQHVDRASVRAAEHAQRRPRNCSAGSLDQHVGRHRRGGIDRRHLLRA